MRTFLLGTLLIGMVAALTISTLAQPPERSRPPRGPERQGGRDRDGDRDALPPPPPPPNPLLEAIDTDHDGTISSQELAAASGVVEETRQERRRQIVRRRTSPATASTTSERGRLWPRPQSPP